jgi:hypothetical protein
MPRKAASATDLMTTIARGVGSAVGKIANTAQRLAIASSEVAKQSDTRGKQAKAPKPSPSARKQGSTRTAAPKSKSKTGKKKSSRSRA